MRFATPTHKASRAFTLIEALAAMLLMAIVIPVAMDGLRVASLAGEVAQRKAVAARLASNELNQLKISGQLKSTQRGVITENGYQYDWSSKTETWTEDTVNPMIVATVHVAFSAQGKSYGVDLSTLIPSGTTL